LKVPLRLFYEDLDAGDDDLEAKITALEAATKGREDMISYDDAYRVIELVELRLEHGDLPDATLAAIYDYGTIPGAIKALKAARPETEEAARKIVLPYSRAEVQDDEEPLDNSDTTPVDDIPDTKPEAKTQETSAAAAASADTVRQDFGPLSKAEHERMSTAIAAAAAENARLKMALAARDREIDDAATANTILKASLARLEAEIAAKSDEAPKKMSVDEHIEALAKLLKTISREGQLERSRTCVASSSSIRISLRWRSEGRERHSRR
jgi:hypothetical protein